MKKITETIAAITLSLLFLSGCKDKNAIKGSQSQKIQAEEKKLTIGFSIDTLAIERWQRDLDVFINKAKELGANVLVQNAGNNLEEQNRQLLYLLDRNVDVIVILPKEADGVSESIQKIHNKNIPIISYDRLILGSPIDLYVTINSEKVGQLMARGMMEKTNKTNWYCILGPEEDFNMTLISQGILKTISNSNVKIGYTYYTSGWNYDLAHQEMTRIISNEIIPDAIICGNDAVADSVISALSTYYNGPHIPICGQDADIAACQSIINGKQDFTIYKPITQLAEIAAEIAVNIANGEKPEDISNGITINNNVADIPVVWLEPQLVDSSNINQVIIDSGFHSHSEVYR